MKAAVKQLKGLSFDVSIDSTYDPKLQPLTVLSQIPEVGSVVKGGRTVFITVNKRNPPLTPMPNLINLSFRIAEMQLKNNKLMLGDTSYQPDIAQGAVLKQLLNGQEIRPGQMVPQGSKISLVIGDGLSNVLLEVPNVVGMPYPEATALLAGSGLTYTPIFSGTISDTASAVVARQTPSAVNDMGATNHIKEGDIIDITVMQSPGADDMDQGGPTNNKTP
jgi:beta-lactam-binding protein with PASTA domain